MLVAIFAVLKSGGCFVPLDPELPAERLRFMLADSGARVLLRREPLPGSLPETLRAVGRAIQPHLVEELHRATGRRLPSESTVLAQHLGDLLLDVGEVVGVFELEDAGQGCCHILADRVPGERPGLDAPAAPDREAHRAL